MMPLPWWVTADRGWNGLAITWSTQKHIQTGRGGSARKGKWLTHVVEEHVNDPFKKKKHSLGSLEILSPALT